MRKHANNKWAVLAAALIVAVAAVPVAAEELGQCEVELSTTSIKTQSEPVLIDATLPESLEADSVNRVVADGDSGILVSIVDWTESESADAANRPEEVSPMSMSDLGDPVDQKSRTLTIRVDSSQARAGKWEIAFYLQNGICTAMLTIEPIEAAEVR